MARVYDEYLYEDDLAPIFESAATYDDSMMLRQNFINNWIRKQLLFQKALDNLTEEQKNKDKELADYYNSLITYEYRQALLHQRLDTVVTREEIEEYFHQNEKNFQLKRNIIRFIYVKLPREAPKLDHVRQWYSSARTEDLDSLQKYAIQFAENFSIDENSWYFLEDILKEVPLTTYDQEHFLKNNKTIEIEDSAYYYLVNILDFRMVEDLSPIEFEVENIRRIIINRRGMNMVRKMEDDIFKEGGAENNYEIY